MKIIYISFLFLWVFVSCKSSDDTDKTLATVGERTITIAEFKDRANFNSHPGKTSLEQYKENILSSIVAEALLSKMDDTALPDYVPLIIHQKNREAVIEKFWEDIIFKDLTVNDSTLWDYYLMTNKRRAIEFAVFDDSVNAQNFSQEWRNNNPLVSRILSVDTLSFSGNIAILEKNVFAAQMGLIAKPLKLGQKYMVYKPVKEWQVALPGRQEFNAKYKSIKKSYIKTLKHEYFMRYAQKTFKKENYQLNKDLFKDLTRVLEDNALVKPKLNEVNTEFLNLTRNNKNTLDPGRIIVSFDNGADWSIADFLKNLAVSPYPLDYSSKGAFRYSLVKATRRMLDDELLYRKGLQYNIDKSDYVIWQTAMWRDFYNANAVIAKGKYSAKEIHQVLDSLQNETEINIHWAIFDTLTINRSDMLVLKTHFPGQTIVPKHMNWNLKIDRE